MALLPLGTSVFLDFHFDVVVSKFQVYLTPAIRGFQFYGGNLLKFAVHFAQHNFGLYYSQRGWGTSGCYFIPFFCILKLVVLVDFGVFHPECCESEF